MNDPYERLTWANHQIEIWPDEDPQDPREDTEQLGTMVIVQDRYISFGDVEVQTTQEWNDWHEDKDIVLELMIKAYIHSGITISADPMRYMRFPDQQWDVSTIGSILVTREKILSEFGPIDDELLKKVRDILIAEVEEYDQYLQGDGWLYIVKDPLDNVVDICGGFYGMDDCVEEAKVAAEAADSGNTRHLLAVN